MKRTEHRIALQAASLVAAVALLAGCADENHLSLPDYQLGAGGAAVDAYDSNGDGAIGGEEFDRVPGLRASLRQVDTDGDGRLTAAEIDARIDTWRAADMAQVAVPCEIKLDGAPLAGARVEFEPEPFLGPNVKPAMGVTGSGGGTVVSMAAEDLPDPRFRGVACGWYKIRITSDDHAIPARYHTATTLGCEAALNSHWSTAGALLLDLSSAPPQ